jgi:hypothetical protein
MIRAFNTSLCTVKTKNKMEGALQLLLPHSVSSLPGLCLVCLALAYLLVLQDEVRRTMKMKRRGEARAIGAS